MNYVEWFTAEELRNSSQNWLSRLNFVKDEQLFLNNLIKDYTLDLLDSKIFPEIKPAINSLREIEYEVKGLQKKIGLHANQLQIMVDDVDQLKMENAYLKTHADLREEISAYFEKYQSTKAKIFGTISSVMKKKKQNRLLKP